MAGSFQSPPFPSVGFDFASSAPDLAFPSASFSAPSLLDASSQPFPSASTTTVDLAASSPVYASGGGAPELSSSFLPSSLAAGPGLGGAAELMSSAAGLSPACFSSAASAAADAALAGLPPFPSAASPSAAAAPLQRLTLSPQEVDAYMQFWRAAGGLSPDSAASVLEGPAAAAFLESSGLDRSLLHEVWRLADVKNAGNLDVESFACACRLVAHAQNGFPVSAEAIALEPAALPQFAKASFAAAASSGAEDPSAGGLPSSLFDLAQSAALAGAFSSPTSGDGGTAGLYAATPEELHRYAQVFADTDTNQDSFIEGEEARTAFQASGALLLGDVTGFLSSSGGTLSSGPGPAPPAVGGPGLSPSRERAAASPSPSPSPLEGTGAGDAGWGSFGFDAQTSFEKDSDPLGPANAFPLPDEDEAPLEKKEKKKSSASSRRSSRSRAKDSGDDEDREERSARGFGAKEGDQGEEEDAPLSFGDRVSAAKAKKKGETERRGPKRSPARQGGGGRRSADDDEGDAKASARRDGKEAGRGDRDASGALRPFGGEGPSLEEKWLARRRERVSAKRAATGAPGPCEESEEERTLALLESVVETDKRLSEILRSEVDGDAEEIEEVRELRVLLETELLAEKKELARQIDRKRDFALQLEDEKIKLEQLKEERRKIEFERLGIERDLAHYMEELLFLRGQVDDMQRDIDSLHQTNQTLLAAHRHQQIQAQNLHATRLQAQEQLKSEREALQKEEREIAELKTLLSRMRREKSEAQSQNAVIHERIRQADQDKSIQFAAIDATRLQAAAVRDDRLQVLQQKQKILGDLNQVAQQTVFGLQRPSARTALPGSAPVETRATVRRDAKGVPAGATASGANLQVLSSRQPVESSPSHWTLFSSLPPRPHASSSAVLGTRGLEAFSDERSTGRHWSRVSPVSAEDARRRFAAVVSTREAYELGGDRGGGGRLARAAMGGGAFSESAFARDLETRGVEALLGIESVKSDGERNYSRTSDGVEQRRHGERHLALHHRESSRLSRRGFDSGAEEDRRRTELSTESDGAVHSRGFPPRDDARSLREGRAGNEDLGQGRSEKKEDKDKARTGSSSSRRSKTSKKKSAQEAHALENGSFSADFLRADSTAAYRRRGRDDEGKKEFDGESVAGEEGLLSGVDTPSFGARSASLLGGPAAVSL
ncbi:EF hand domain-containing protein [Besnoitia besnoiti]|uniref:EF hand domain-containing protein n=1 Tax=Besnoitia besnoiti TaxID=94643 RepID=A0A2A9M969_BESBE|nr:EF hand domain-containing protein [Besnoitia besnoiti]PFH35028.1 EF hand domain-containing protein [Besnoitia besnoiti]